MKKSAQNTKAEIDYRNLTFNVKAVDTEKHIVRGVFSTEDEDRHREIVDQAGWKTEEFMQNPVVLWAHDQWQPAIGKVVELTTENGKLEGAVQFAVEEYDFAATIFNLMAGEYIRAFSVGFRNEKWEVDEANDVIILKENTLYELSVVNVPANAMALAKSKGVDVAPLERKAAAAHAANARVLGKQVEEETEETETEEPETDTATDVEKALETLCNSDAETIKAAVKALTGSLDATGADTPDGESGGGRAPREKAGRKNGQYRKVNRVIRTLLKAKE